MSAEQNVDGLSREFEGAGFLDERLTRRLVDVAMALGRRPDESFPEATGGDGAALEGTYRFLNNEQVTPDRIFWPHLRATLGRVSEASGEVVVAHDTTEFNFGTETVREGLGHVGHGKSRGFFGHFALAVSADHDALGVLGSRMTFRMGDPHGNRTRRQVEADPENEGLRWRELFSDVQERLDGRLVTHVMDREADSYVLMAFMYMRGGWFVVRMCHNRALSEDSEHERIQDKLVGLEIRLTREVFLSARGRNPTPSSRRHHPPRNARRANLAASAVTATIRRPVSAPDTHLKELTLNLVRVHEIDPPAGEEAVEWCLWTNRPVETPEQIEAVIDAYRCRWVIEEFFKSIKTGCAFEKRQLESRHALLNALAIFVPIAWRLLRLRHLARQETPISASNVLTSLELFCLRGALRRIHRRELPDKPTIRDAMLGVAALGGHIVNNGPPGWIVLGRGFDRLLTMALGASLVENQDQS